MSGGGSIAPPVTLGDDSDPQMAGASQLGVPVRISARLQDDGRIEFALQQQDVSGQWEERQLPRSRYLPENAGVGRWLSSSPLTVSVPRESTGPTSGVDQAENPSAESGCRLADHVDRLTGATFQVVADSGTGSAFYVGQDEWLTNHHVVATANKVRLVRGDYTVIATVIGSLPNYDLALLRAPAPFSVQPLGFAANQQSLGSNVSVIGFPTGVSGTPSLTRGVISRYSLLAEFDGFSGPGAMVQIDAAINPGNSGGPMSNDCGEVVGIATLKLFTASDGRDIEGIGYGVASGTVVAQLPALREASHVAPMDAVVEEATAEEATFGVTFSQWSADGSEVLYGHKESSSGAWATTITLSGVTDHALYERGVMVLGCAHDPGDEHFFIVASAHDPHRDHFTAPLTSGGTSIFKIERSGNLVGKTYVASVSLDSSFLVREDAKHLMSNIRLGDWLGATLPQRFGNIIILFDLAGVFDSPVEHLFERCLKS